MATYSFPQFKVIIVNPEITIKQVNDDINNKSCSVDIILKTSQSEFGVNLSGFTYSTTWEDNEIISWVNQEIQNYTL